MNKLVINTANSELFIVLQKDNEIFSSSLSSTAKHNETMLNEIDALLQNNGLDISKIDEFGVIIGPGSFTGIRVGVATIKAFRDVFGVKAKGINNLDYLFKLAQAQDENINVVAIAGSKNNYFVARVVNGFVYKYERTCSLNELLEISQGGKVGFFAEESGVNCLCVKQRAKEMIECLDESNDENLIPVYYQLSQAESEKNKKLNIEIVEAGVQDLDNIYNLEQQTKLPNKLTKEMLQDILKNENYKIFKATAPELFLGFVVVQTSDEVNIDNIVVDKDYRNLGIASKLIAEVENYARNNGISTVSLEVSNKNINAYLLYDKLGFKQRRIRRNYYLDGSDCIEMFKIVNN